MSVRQLLVAAQSADTYALTTGRFVATVAGLVALAGVVIGARALARARRTGSGRRGSVVAVVMGLAGAVTGGVVVLVADGGPGSGSGIVGGYVALVLGVAAAVLGGLALTHAGRAEVRA